MLKLFDPRWLLFVMLLTVAALPVRTHASTPTVVISEIAWAGSSSSASDEWIELTNVSDTAVDLSGWKLTGAGSSNADLVLPDGARLEPHSTYLIANYEHTHANSALAGAPSYVTASLSLPNGGFDLSLYDAGNAPVDVAGGTGAPFAGGSGGTGDSLDGRYRSMVRTDGLGDGSLEESWTDADTASGFKTGVEDLGTPGIVAFSTSSVIPSETSEASEVEGSPSEEIVEEELVEKVVVEEPVEETTDEETVVEEIIEEPVTEEAIVGIRISEFVVDPHEGEAEWIELVNAGGASIDLTGWIVEDAAGKQTVLESTLEAGGYLVIDAPLGKLNNDTDSILLKDATGVLVDSVEYGTDELAAPKDGAALARGASGSFELTYAASPEGVNMIDPEKPEVVETPEEVEEVEQVDEAVEVAPGFPARHSLGDGGSLGEAEADIRISEFVVDPMEEAVEWIELYNAGDASVTLEGWTLEDASAKVTDLSAVTIEADSYVIVESPKGKLNNDADSVILKDASGAIVESVVYGGEGYPVPKDGNSLARDGETFEVTELITPGSPNLIFIALEELVEVDESSTSSDLPEEVTILKTLRFVTLYPNTTGSDEEEEYITIENTGTEAIDLLGWSIEDGSTKRFTFEDSTGLAAGATMQVVRPQTKLTLNNGGDTLELIAPDGDVIDLLTYGNSAKGETYDLIDGIWSWSGTTPVAESTATESAVAESTTTSTPAVTTQTNTSNTTNATYASATASTRVAQSLTIAQAKEKTDGQRVMVKGVVISSPGVFGNQIFYIQDDTGGIQIYLYSGDFPELALGDVVQITGELSTSRGERRVKLASAAGVVLASATFSSQPIELAVSDVDEALVGILMMTQGVIQSIDTNKLILEKEGATLTVYLKQNPVIDAQQFQRGDKIEVTGVLTTYDGELRLRPRGVSDITVVENAPVASAVTTESSTGSSAGMILLTTTMAALVALALWRYLPRRRLTPAHA